MEGVMKDFRQLKVWEKAHAFVLEIYRITARFPKEEMYGLTSQLRRSAGSISTNIAEGCGRGSDAELARFVQISMGSACEAEYQLLLAHDLGFIADPDHEELSQDITEVKRMLTGFIKILKADR
jgi:four helix bundle protein